MEGKRQTQEEGNKTQGVESGKDEQDEHGSDREGVGGEEKGRQPEMASTCTSGPYKIRHQSQQRSGCPRGTETAEGGFPWTSHT